MNRFAGLKLLGSVAVIEYAECTDLHTDELENCLRCLAHPSLGHWWGLVRRLVPILGKSDDPGFRKVRDILFGKSRDDMPRAAGLEALLIELSGGPASTKSTVRLVELFDRLVNFRNRDLNPTTDLRAVLRGLLEDHLRADPRTLQTAVFPDSANVQPLRGLLA